MAVVRVLYEISGHPDASAFARSIAFEQTVELPEELTSPQIREAIVARVLSVEPGRDGSSRAWLAYPANLVSGDLSQLLNLIYGNISLLPGIRIAELELPDEVLSSFAGPRHGISGIREIAGIQSRPLLATALKPRGASPAELAEIAYQFAMGGGDLVKDDHNLVDAERESFRERVLRCRDRVEEANRSTGNRTLYFPHLAGPAHDLRERASLLAEEGIRGVLVAPLLLGLEATRELLREVGFMALAHPSLTGSFFQNRDHGIAVDVLLGTLFRLSGADGSIFPNYDGRFPFRRPECLALSRRLRSPLGTIAPAFPVPAGGLRFESIAALAADYGVDAIYLIGGALLGHTRDLRDRTRRFRAALEHHFKEPGALA